jgi:hypothetical protein
MEHLGTASSKSVALQIRFGGLHGSIFSGVHVFAHLVQLIEALTIL